MEENSVLANAAYTYNDSAEDSEETLKEISEYGLEGYMIDKDLSDDESVVFLNPENDEITLSIRGTDPNKFDPEDWWANYQIITGSETDSERHYGEYDKMRKIIDKYPDKKIKTTGHSLGGQISYKLGRDFNVEGHHFNAGASIREVFENLVSTIYCGKDCEALKKQNFYTTALDPLSFWNMHPILDQFGKQNVKYQYRPEMGLMGHSINHFLPPKKGEKIIERTFLTPYDMYKDIEKRGFIKMEARPRGGLPISRDYCSDNPKDPKCLLINRNR